MRNLKDFLKEELYAVPANTMGMGNVSMPSMDNSVVGSGDIPCACMKRCNRKHNKKRNAVIKNNHIRKT